MDDGRTVGVSKVYAPTAFAVALSVEDSEKLGEFTETLAGELETYLMGHADEQGYDLVGRPTVAFDVHDDLKLGRFRVSATHAAQPRSVDVAAGGDDSAIPTAAYRSASALATVTVSDTGHDVALKGDRVEVGRLGSCDICLADVNVSRIHSAFVREGEGWAIEDLDSTNGTLLNGERVTHTRLHNGDRVQVGATQLIYHDPKG